MANEENLKPFKKGDPRINRKGRRKGTKNWSSIVKQILEDEELFDAILEGKEKPTWLVKLNKKNAANAIVVSMVKRALSGDKRAADWLRKTGYGDKITHGFDDGLFQSGKLEIEIVKSKNPDERDSESQL